MCFKNPLRQKNRLVRCTSAYTYTYIVCTFHFVTTPQFISRQQHENRYFVWFLTRPNPKLQSKVVFETFLQLLQRMFGTYHTSTVKLEWEQCHIDSNTMCFPVQRYEHEVSVAKMCSINRYIASLSLLIDFYFFLSNHAFNLFIKEAPEANLRFPSTYALLLVVNNLSNTQKIHPNSN